MELRRNSTGIRPPQCQLGSSTDWVTGEQLVHFTLVLAQSLHPNQVDPRPQHLGPLEDSSSSPIV